MEMKPANANSAGADNKTEHPLKSPINFLTLFLLGIFILFIGVAAYYFTLLIVQGTLLPSFDRIGFPTQKGLFLSKTLSPTKITTQTADDSIRMGKISLKRVRIGIIKQESVIGTFPTPEVINDNLLEWFNFFTQESIQFETIHIEEIELGKANYDVLILPANPFLSDWEISQIANFLDQGGGLIAIGDCGLMDEKGRERVVPFLSRIIGIAKVKDGLKPAKSYCPLTVKANSPLAISFPLGTRIGTVADYGYVRAQVIEERTTQDGYWYNPFFDSGIPQEEISNSTGLCHGRYNGGRFVWFGFGINSITGDEFSQEIKPKLIRNALLWVTQKPLAQIRPWPKGYQCAAVISGDIENNFNNVSKVIKLFNEKKIKGTFFLLSDLVRSNQSLVKAMAKVGEIGLHGNLHIELKDLPYEFQLKEIQKSKATLERICSSKITGFRPPYGSFDENTLRALDKTGLNYLVSAIAGGNTLAPEFFPQLNDFIIIPKPNKDDYDIFYRDSITTLEAVKSELKDEFDRIYDLGGYYVLTYHSQILAAPPNYLAIAQMIDYMKNRKVWITTWQEIADWWRKIRNIELFIEDKDSFNFNLTLNNFGKATVENIQVQVFPGDLFTDSAKIQIRSSTREPIEWDFDAKTKSYNILIKKLKPKAFQRVNFILRS